MRTWKCPKFLARTTMPPLSPPPTTSHRPECKASCYNKRNTEGRKTQSKTANHQIVKTTNHCASFQLYVSFASQVQRRSPPNLLQHRCDKCATSHCRSQFAMDGIACPLDTVHVCMDGFKHKICVCLVFLVALRIHIYRSSLTHGLKKGFCTGARNTLCAVKRRACNESHSTSRA